MSDDKISMPGGIGGLVRYDSEYGSRFMISPIQVVTFILLIIVAVLLFRVFFPVQIVAG